MAQKCFVDTNVFVYARDGRDTIKQRAAEQLLKKLIKEDCLVVSPQVIQEFCNVSLKPEFELTKEELHQTLDSMLFPFVHPVVSVDHFKNAL